MADCKIPAHYPNQIDVTRTPLAFGDRAVPRLVRFFKKNHFSNKITKNMKLIYVE